MSYEVQKYLANLVRLGYDTFITRFTNNKAVKFIFHVHSIIDKASSSSFKHVISFL